MIYHPSLRSVTEDRDLSRAANERYLMLQALSERQDRASDSRRSQLATLVQAVRALWLSSLRRAVTADQAGTAK